MRLDTIEAITRIDERTAEIANDLADIKCQLSKHTEQITALQLSRARLDGQMELMWKIVAFFGITGTAALIKAFMDTVKP